MIKQTSSKLIKEGSYNSKTSLSALSALVLGHVVKGTLLEAKTSDEKNSAFQS